MKTSKKIILNSYKIYWTVIQLKNGFAIYEYGANKELARKKRDKIIKKLKNKHGYAYLITDKQFGLANNNNITDILPELAKPFKYSITTFDDNIKCRVPITKNQFFSRIKF